MKYDELTLRIAKAWTDHIHGGRADDKTPDDFDSDSIAKGREVEFEHTDDPDIATEIAMDHLNEFSDYYEGLEEMEDKLKLER